MKKITLMILLLAAMTLTACEKNNLQSNIIVRAELTDREIGLLSATSYQSFVFDFHSDSENKEVSMWIEKYEFGRLAKEHIAHFTTEVSGNGSIFVITNKQDDSPNQLFFNVGVQNNGNIALSSISDIISNKDTDRMASVWGINNEEIPITNDELILGSIVFTSSGGTMSSLSSNFYNDVEGQVKEIENYDAVYLLKSKFGK